MTYPSKRRYDIQSIGQYIHKAPGRPSGQDKVWRESCNFVFKTEAKVASAPGFLGENGWLVRIFAAQDTAKGIFISSDVASSNTSLRKQFMQAFPGCICRITSEDFLDFVSADNPTSIIYSADGIGKIQTPNGVAWIFPNVVLHAKKNNRVLLNEKGLKTRSLPAYPQPCLRPHKDFLALYAHLANCIRKVYPHSFMQVFHMLTASLKAVHYDAIMEAEHFVPVTNISGPANVGKTLACAIALHLVECSSLMLSRCTSSSLLDASDTFRNLLVVWDDPRDTTASQMSTIVHEAFNGLVSTTVSKGTRRYNSPIVIGTQKALLGMPHTDVNAATFSRLSHIIMTSTMPFRAQTEPALQDAMASLRGSLSFLIKYTHYDPSAVDRCANAIDNTAITHRAHRIAAVDCYFMEQLDRLGIRNSAKEREEYFARSYLPFLHRWVSTVSPFDQFLRHLQKLQDTCEPPNHCFKGFVLVDLKEHGPCECISFYTKTFFDFMHATLPESKIFTKEWVHSYVKHNSNVGEVSRNVAYRVGNGTHIKRSVVIRRSLLA